MKENFWGAAFIVGGIIGIALIFLMLKLTVRDQNDFYSLKEVTKASMIDAIDLEYYQYHGEFRIVRDRFVESFIRRWSAASTNGQDVYIEINDVIEMPPKVSVTVKTQSGKLNYSTDENDFEVVNKIDGILESLNYE